MDDLMKHSTDYNATIAELGMGDRFQLSHHGAVTVVAWTDASADGTVVYVRDSAGETELLATYRRCRVVERAPRCGCGRRFENCDQSCDWPSALDALFMV
jgi:hypothetical protein